MVRVGKVFEVHIGYFSYVHIIRMRTGSSTRRVWAYAVNGRDWACDVLATVALNFSLNIEGSAYINISETLYPKA
jgi:hypothetical protein